MDWVFGSLNEEGWSIAKSLLSIGMLKVVDFVAKASGNVLRQSIKRISVRYLIFFCLAITLLIGSNIAF